METEVLLVRNYFYYPLRELTRASYMHDLHYRETHPRSVMLAYLALSMQYVAVKQAHASVVIRGENKSTYHVS